MELQQDAVILQIQILYAKEAIVQYPMTHHN